MKKIAILVMLIFSSLCATDSPSKKTIQKIIFFDEEEESSNTYESMFCFFCSKKINDPENDCKRNIVHIPIYPCEHRFHYNCIKKHLQNNHRCPHKNCKKYFVHNELLKFRNPNLVLHVLFEAIAEDNVNKVTDLLNLYNNIPINDLYSFSKKDDSPKNNSTLLHFAVKKKSINVIRFLLSEKQASTTVLDGENNIPLFLTMDFNYSDEKFYKNFSPKKEDSTYTIIKLLLENTPEEKRQQIINTPYTLGRTFLLAATCHGYSSVVKLLLSFGANINTQCSLFEDTCLHWAVIFELKEIVEILLKNGADKTIKNIFEKTALDIAEELFYNYPTENIRYILELFSKY